jgi:hypothetical protein
VRPEPLVLERDERLHVLRVDAVERDGQPPLLVVGEEHVGGPAVAILDDDRRRCLVHR